MSHQSVIRPYNGYLLSLNSINISGPSKCVHMILLTFMQVKVNGMTFAAKIIHRILITENSVVIRNFITRECPIMSEVCHPNIVQFLGLCKHEVSVAPIMIMERLISNLHNFLESTADIPFALKLSMLKNVADGLCYLHGHNPSIIHRDLTATNVLLDSYFVAKISDFGNSRIVPQSQFVTVTANPGKAEYMPPEASEVDYSKPLDVFSFGHLSLFVLVQASYSPFVFHLAHH